MNDARDRLARLSPEKRALLVRRLKERQRERPNLAPAWPTLTPDPENRHEPFPLTPLQQAYWIGRGPAFGMGQVATHSYMELEGQGLDLVRLESAWNALIDRHHMLRARFLPDGRQETLASVEAYVIDVDDLTADSDDHARTRLAEIRSRMSHAVLDPGRWPLFELRAALLRGGRVRLFLGVDALIVDAWSVGLIFDEWATLYENDAAELPALAITFRDYVLGLERVESGEAFQRAEAYWQARVSDLPPPPALPMARSPADLETTTFVRRTATLSPARWAKLQEKAGRAGMTVTAITLAAYADVLSIWSERPRFTLSVPQFNRHPLHDHVDRIVGEFASFSLLDVDNRGEAGFAERARRHQDQLWQDLDHAVFGGVPVLRELAKLTPGGAAPIMPIVFTSAPQGADGGGVGEALPETLWKVVYVNNQSSQVWLDNHLSERDGALVCDWDTVDDLFPDGMPEAMLGAFIRHLERLADDAAWWDRSWVEAASELLPPAHLAVHDVAGGAEMPIPDERIQDTFYRRVEESPEALAVATSGERFTYRELAQEIDHCAGELQAAGVGAGCRVGIVMDKGWEQVVAAYACLEIGAAYVPFDAGDPPARRARLLDRAGAAAILIQPWLEAIDGWPEGTPRLGVRRAATDAGAGEATGPRREAPSTGSYDVAFVLFTSGSTGEPKAVQIDHRGVVNALLATQREFELSPADRVLGLTALHHDLSVFDTFGVLGAGGTLVVPDSTGRRDPAHWVELMRRESVTVWNSVPAMMTMLLAYADEGRSEIPSTLRLGFLGGDWIPVTLPGRLRRHLPEVELVSVGGPTETTLWNIWHRIGDPDPEAPSIPYGKPIANTRYHVLAPEGAERPLDVPGELWVSGPGVTRGYLDDDQATVAKRGVHPRTGETMWSTGDLGRRLHDGSIEFVGRADFQVQLRGHRVELGEIEAHVTRFEGVEQAVVAAVEDPRGGLQLVTYVVWGSEPAPDELTRHLASRLPAHMVPTSTVTLDALPLTRNGKVDRNALPAPATGTEATGVTGAGEVEGSAQPESSVEGSVIELIEEVLGTRVAADANLLEYGANSIDMVRIGNRLEDRFGSRPPIDEIFRLQTARALAAYYDRVEAVEAQSAPTDTSDPIAARLASYRVALSPEEREAFKAKQLGVRSDLDGFERVELALPMGEDELAAALWERRTHRRFGLRPVTGDSFGGFLAGLAQRTVQGGSKRLYGSPGGLYPTQIYLHLKPGRVEGVEGGRTTTTPSSTISCSSLPGPRSAATSTFRSSIRPCTMKRRSPSSSWSNWMRSGHPTGGVRSTSRRSKRGSSRPRSRSGRLAGGSVSARSAISSSMRSVTCSNSTTATSFCTRWWPGPASAIIRSPARSPEAPKETCVTGFWNASRVCHRKKCRGCSGRVSVPTARIRSRDHRFA